MLPGCHEQPNVDGTPLAEIAFICSPIPGGARYDYTLGEIASVDDMLVLCPNHHMLIDSYPEEFSVERLREFKSSGRADAGNSKGDALPFAKLSLDKALEYWGRHRRESKEDFWQSFFEANPHVLSLAFPSAVFRMGSKFYVGGKTTANSGGNLADFAFGETSTQNILLVEIKTPETKLLGRQYREGVYAPSSDLSGSIAQVLSQADNLQKDFFSVCRDHVGAFAIGDGVTALRHPETLIGRLPVGARQPLGTGCGSWSLIQTLCDARRAPRTASSLPEVPVPVPRALP